MNIFHIKYAVEVAKVGSINKASENLGMAQPNISRAIKDLEADFGITIFDRSAKGMTLTPEGREFIVYSQKILDQMNELERIYKGDHPGREKLSIAVPRAGYIREAVIRFVKTLDESAFEVIIADSSAERAVKGIIDSECNLAIIRCTDATEPMLMEIFKEKHITSVTLKELTKSVIISKSSRLAEKDIITKDDLEGMTEVTDGEAWERTHAFEALRGELHDHGERCIHANDSLTQLELIADNDNYFMLSPSISESDKARYGLAEIAYAESRTFKDVLIYRADHKLSRLENDFCNSLK